MESLIDSDDDLGDRNCNFSLISQNLKLNMTQKARAFWVIFFCVFNSI